MKVDRIFASSLVFLLYDHRSWQQCICLHSWSKWNMQVGLCTWWSHDQQRGPIRLPVSYPPLLVPRATRSYCLLGNRWFPSCLETQTQVVILWILSFYAFYMNLFLIYLVNKYMCSIEYVVIYSTFLKLTGAISLSLYWYIDAMSVSLRLELFKQ